MVHSTTTISSVSCDGYSPSRSPRSSTSSTRSQQLQYTTAIDTLRTPLASYDHNIQHSPSLSHHRPPTHNNNKLRRASRHHQSYSSDTFDSHYSRSSVRDREDTILSSDCLPSRNSYSYSSCVSPLIAVTTPSVGHHRSHSTSRRSTNFVQRGCLQRQSTAPQGNRRPTFHQRGKTTSAAPSNNPFLSLLSNKAWLSLSAPPQHSVFCMMPTTQTHSPTQGYYQLISPTFTYTINTLSTRYGRGNIKQDAASVNKAIMNDQNAVIVGNSKLLSRTHFSIEWDSRSQKWVLIVIGKNTVEVNKQQYGISSHVALHKDKASAIRVADVKLYFLPAVKTVATNAAANDHNKNAIAPTQV